MRHARLIAAGMVLALALLLGMIAWNVPVAKNPTDAVQVSREAGGNAAITVTVTRAGEGILDQPGIGQDLSAMKGKVLPFALALDTHDGD
ncbi:MAG TPA: hypothetical protein VD902_21600, partial [Symbiobacteriaceae bacterium]|nr:hypothetical protein [Symbiobacteriaceae bacterium]